MSDKPFTLTPLPDKGDTTRPDAPGKQPVTASADGLRGPCVWLVANRPDGSNRCGKPGRLVELIGHLASTKDVLCDRHITICASTGLSVREIKPGELL